MQIDQLINSLIYYPAYEGGDGDGDGAGGAGDQEPENPFKDWKEGDKIPEPLQRQLNSVIKKEKDKHDRVISGLRDEIQTISKRSNFTEEERAEQEKRLQDLQSELLTTEEKAKAEMKRLQGESEQKINSLTEQRDNWRSRFESDRIHNSIIEAAVSSQAYNPSQIHTLLRDQASVKEVLGDDGKPTGEFSVSIKVETIDEDTKKPKQLDLSPKEAVEHIKKQKDHSNLFKFEGSGGMGGSNLPSDAQGIKDIAADPDSYRKHREQIMKE